MIILMRLLILLLEIQIIYGLVISPIFNNWYCLDFIKNVDKSKPLKFNIGDMPLVIWFKNETTPLSTINICSHQGSKLDSGKINNKGCLICPYHGLSHDKSMAYGKTIIHEGKLWWSYNNDKKPPSIPFYNNKNYKKTEISVDMNANILDCIHNLIDINHPQFIHNSILGFGNTNDPISNVKIFNYKNKKKLGLSLNYKSNTKLRYVKQELKTSNNFHIYDYPFTSWSRVSLNNKQNLFVYVNLLPLTKDTTRWFITLSHNYWKSDVEMKLMELAGRVILDQDKDQMNIQAKTSKLKSMWINKIKINNEDHLEDLRKIIKTNNDNSLDLYPSI